MESCPQSQETPRRAPSAIGRIAPVAAPKDPNDTSALSYEEARDELVRVVNELEQGSSTLEQSLALWERGEALAKRCEEWLVGAKARLDAARAAATN
jgi:exodeoxyribonuclease VII small subunit